MFTMTMKIFSKLFPFHLFMLLVLVHLVHSYPKIVKIECPPADDGSERVACPSPDASNRWRCIDDHALCDGYPDCPRGEDEDGMSCMFYKTTKAHLDVLADALIRWARGRY